MPGYRKNKIKAVGDLKDQLKDLDLTY
jgi:hypothetical protein